MKKDYFNNEISYSALFMWKMETMHLESRKTFQEEFIVDAKNINSRLNKNKICIINAMVFGELITKKSISDYLKKDPGNISRSVDELIASGVIRKNVLKVDGKETKILSLNKKFYSKYIEMINKYFERVYIKDFIPAIEEIGKQMKNKKVEGIAKTLRKIKK
ncbi:hypothetical protein [Mycoplasma todarodis]|uniref:HTH marR-type domain-containing protein n=1 Tax=Mycoplasma todarodis TaxID=1937191 RepID=A0A4R0XUM9_9MOLU|nr:hypothetical protein [Mycoplasma todarodis]TCG10591.1 hypothetical protein C4B25_03550 [Mycoplasma todarodis]